MKIILKNLKMEMGKTLSLQLRTIPVGGDSDHDIRKTNFDFIK